MTIHRVLICLPPPKEEAPKTPEPLDPAQIYLYQGPNEAKAEGIYKALRDLLQEGLLIDRVSRICYDSLETSAGVLRLLCRTSCELTTDGRFIELLHPTPQGARTRL